MLTNNNSDDSFQSTEREISKHKESTLSLNKFETEMDSSKINNVFTTNELPINRKISKFVTKFEALPMLKPL